MKDRHASVGVGVVLRRDGLVLVGLRSSGIQPGTWGLPGGHIAFGETWEACARREAREETVRWEWHRWDALPAPLVRSLDALRKSGYRPSA